MSRRPVHAGQWYPSAPTDLVNELDRDFESLVSQQSMRMKAIISPHAGIRYSGPTAAAAYATVDTSEIRRVFILGPCHHVYVEGCALPESGVVKYDTPLGDLLLDQDVLHELRATEYSTFKTMRLPEDEQEHSIEMQLPFLRYILQGRDAGVVRIVPIYVGTLVHNEERIIGRILSKYFDDPSALFIISSDFCHWGNRFRYTPSSFPSPCCNKAHKYPIDSMNGRIEALDRQAMDLIENQDAEGFAKYLQSTGNTICGRYPIQVFMEVLRNSAGRHKVEFIHYAHSTILPKEVSRNDASVSYAAAICY